jgi:hypothetical protein
LTKDLEAKVFGLNAAILFQVDVEAKRKDLPKVWKKALLPAITPTAGFPHKFPKAPPTIFWQ